MAHLGRKQPKPGRMLNQSSEDEDLCAPCDETQVETMNHALVSSYLGANVINSKKGLDSKDAPRHQAGQNVGQKTNLAKSALIAAIEATVRQEVAKSPTMRAIRARLDRFVYDDGPGLASCLVGKPLEAREFTVLASGEQYLGQWLVGTETRAGIGVAIGVDGSIYQGYWSDN